MLRIIVFPTFEVSDNYTNLYSFHKYLVALDSMNQAIYVHCQVLKRRKQLLKNSHMKLCELSVILFNSFS